MPPVIELPNLAIAQDWLVWLGLDPLEKYAHCPFFIISFKPLIEHPVFFDNFLLALIFSILYNLLAFNTWPDFLYLKDFIFFLVWNFPVLYKDLDLCNYLVCFFLSLFVKDLGIYFFLNETIIIYILYKIKYNYII